MTRLKVDDVVNIPKKLGAYDAELVSKTGVALRGVACRAVGLDESVLQRMSSEVRVAVIPITSGKGIIQGFADAVKSIATHIGFDAFITASCDVAGLAEAFDQKADVLMLSDDDRFVAIHVASRHVAENADATGKGFVSGLNLMARGLSGQKVLVIGCGPVGRRATKELIRLGALPSVYDAAQDRCRDWAKAIPHPSSAEIRIETDLNRALLAHQYIIDASPAPNIIHRRHVTGDRFIAVPGMPTGLSAAAREAVSDRYLHDPLQIGVATMMIEVVKASCADGAVLRRTWDDDA